ncbi:cbb3-type cytochrome oxidase subunit 3 [Paenibacillus rhizosphaerae]|jgi:cbb3-type cytochrome oxidase subunit 3|uniref:Cbb3-type cytochrome oxidase subunit 3 n=2 Tax=Paenibacillus TaxID=44249 RepID=A0A839TU34_9BACL|nr:cbb3-type cytochrome oxidase subunit 3 [Paenibacillus rhizosphaerae]RED37174.1 hypothetical protein C7820_3968 [Paenibacillus sp. VMFN-D1]
MSDLEYPMETLFLLIVFIAALFVMLFWLKRRGKRDK